MAFKLYALAWSAHGLSQAEQVVLLRLADHANVDTRICWPAASTLALACRMSVRTVGTALSGLKAAGHISMLPPRPGTKTPRYRFHPQLTSNAIESAAEEFGATPSANWPETEKQTSRSADRTSTSAEFADHPPRAAKQHRHVEIGKNRHGSSADIADKPVKEPANKPVNITTTLSPSDSRAKNAAKVNFATSDFSQRAAAWNKWITEGLARVGITEGKAFAWGQAAARVCGWQPSDSVRLPYETAELLRKWEGYDVSEEAGLAVIFELQCQKALRQDHEVESLHGLDAAFRREGQHKQHHRNLQKVLEAAQKGANLRT